MARRRDSRGAGDRYGASWWCSGYALSCGLSSDDRHQTARVEPRGDRIELGRRWRCGAVQGVVLAEPGELCFAGRVVGEQVNAQCGGQGTEEADGSLDVLAVVVHGGGGRGGETRV